MRRNAAIAQAEFATRLTVNGKLIERTEVTKLYGVWISVDLTWSRNTAEICRKSFSRLSMLTKLKYVGVPIEDLIDVYNIFSSYGAVQSIAR